jgi:predicted dehydrogenase
MQSNRRTFLKAAGLTAASASRILGANGRVNTAFIGMGRMGRENLRFAAGQENVNVTAVCDVYDLNLNKASEFAKKKFPEVKSIRDFREILADKSIDAVCISTPDNWHAYMTVEACKAGKDVYVEKPVSVTVDEARKMVEAARKYNRVVQAGTMQRSAVHFQKAVEIVKSGELGPITTVHCWNYGNMPPEGIGNPPDSDPPAGLDWDMWLGPAPKRPFNENRFGVDPNDRWFAHFRWFWDYAGGMMTDWGVHWIDIVQFAFDEAMPTVVNSVGGKWRLKDNRDTPDTIHASYEYPGGCLVTYENRYGNAQSMFNKGGGILFNGDKATMFVDRSEYRIIPERVRGPMAAPPKGQPQGNPQSDVVQVKSSESGNARHWANFLECIKSRQRPNSDIEKCARSSSACILANVALRSHQRLDWDHQKWTVRQNEAKKFLSREERKPWRISV